VAGPYLLVFFFLTFVLPTPHLHSHPSAPVGTHHRQPSITCHFRARTLGHYYIIINMPYSKKRKYSKKRNYKKAYKKPKFSKSLRVAVSRIMTRKIETKTLQLSSEVQQVYNTIDNTRVHNLIPSLFQGLGQAGRVGNKVNPVSLTVRLSLTCANLLTTYALCSPTYFDLYIFKWKSADQGGGSPLAADMVRFLQDNAVAQAYNGELMDGLRPVNADQFQLLVKRRVTLSNFAGNQVTQGVFQQTNPNRTFYFNLSKHLKKTWLYDDTSSFVENDNFYIAIGSTQTDGQSTGTTLTGNYQYIADLRFKDA